MQYVCNVPVYDNRGFKIKSICFDKRCQALKQSWSAEVEAVVRVDEFVEIMVHSSDKDDSK